MRADLTTATITTTVTITVPTIRYMCVSVGVSALHYCAVCGIGREKQCMCVDFPQAYVIVGLAHIWLEPTCQPSCNYYPTRMCKG